MILQTYNLIPWKISY